MSSEASSARIWISVIVALTLTVLPLPTYLDIARPSFLVITVLFFSVASPWAGGIGLGWFSGLLLDVFQGPVLGEHALVLAAVTYVTAREHQRIRSKPMFQQSLIVLALLAAYEGLVFIVDGYTGHPLTSPLRWVHCLTGALIWAPTSAILAAGRRS